MFLNNIKKEDLVRIVNENEEFVMKETEHYDVFNYILQYSSTFDINDKDYNLKKEMRGLILDKEGNILSRRLHKFFNINEKEFTNIDNIDFSKPHRILTKEDGSMVTPVNVDGNLEWHFKMGYNNDLSPLVEDFVSKNENYYGFAYRCIYEDVTPIFEFCSNKQRIVIDQPIDRLILLAVRDNTTGEYLDFNHYILKSYIEQFNIDVVKQYNTDNILTFIGNMKDKTGIEGVVIRFGDGEMYKVKTDEYIRLHRFFDLFRFKKNIWKVILNNESDDVRSELPLDKQEILEDNEQEILDLTKKIIKIVSKYSSSNRKQLALSIKENHKFLMSLIMNHNFKENFDLKTEIRSMILKNCNRNIMLDNFLGKINGI